MIFSRPQIWEEFVNRFNIKDISEFFGSTEGNANIGEFPFYDVANLKGEGCMSAGI
jgi:hypothetical protein